jgi:hypothetical protein
LQRKKKHKVCKQWPCNGRREHLEIMFDYERNFLTMEKALHDKGIIEKLKGEEKGLAFYTTTNKLKP